MQEKEEGEKKRGREGGGCWCDEGERQEEELTLLSSLWMLAVCVLLEFGPLILLLVGDGCQLPVMLLVLFSGQPTEPRYTF